MLKQLIELTPTDTIDRAKESGYKSVHIIKSKGRYYICNGAQELHPWEKSIFCGTPSALQERHFEKTQGN